MERMPQQLKFSIKFQNLRKVKSFKIIHELKLSLSNRCSNVVGDLIMTTFLLELVVPHEEQDLTAGHGNYHPGVPCLHTKGAFPLAK